MRSTPGPAGHQRVDFAAAGAMVGLALDVAAEVAHQRAAEAVVDHPGRALAAGEAVPAGAAQRQGRVAAAVEEQQRLPAVRDRVGDGGGERRRDPAAARRGIPAHVDRRQRRHGAAGVARCEPQVAVAPRLGVDAGFERRGRRGQHHGGLLEAAAHHRHVAGVIAHAVVLLVGGLVFLVDDDEPEVGEGQEQRRARARHDLDVARRDAGPGPRPPPHRHAGMPFRRAHAEALGEAVEELRRQGDLGQEDERLAAGAQRGGDGLEVGLRLARARDAFEQADGEAPLGRPRGERRGGLGLRGIESHLGRVGIGRRRQRVGRQRHRLQRAFVDEAVDHAGRAVGGLGQGLLRGDRRGVRAVEHRHHSGAGRRHALRGRAGAAQADPHRLGTGEFRRPDRHAQHHAARAQRPGGEPVDEAPQRLAHRRPVLARHDLLQVVAAGGARVPHHAERLPRAERHHDEVAGREGEALRHAIRIGGVDRDGDQHVDDGRRRGIRRHGASARRASNASSSGRPAMPTVAPRSSSGAAASADRQRWRSARSASPTPSRAASASARSALRRE